MSGLGSGNSGKRYALIEGRQSPLMFHGEGQKIKICELAWAKDLIVVKASRIAERQRVHPERVIRCGKGVRETPRDVGDCQMPWVVRLREDPNAGVLR